MSTGFKIICNDGHPDVILGRVERGDLVTFPRTVIADGVMLGGRSPDAEDGQRVKLADQRTIRAIPFVVAYCRRCRKEYRLDVGKIAAVARRDRLALVSAVLYTPT